MWDRKSREFQDPSAMSGTHAERPVSGLFLTELEKLDLYTLNASRTERFLRKDLRAKCLRDWCKKVENVSGLLQQGYHGAK